MLLKQGKTLYTVQCIKKQTIMLATQVLPDAEVENHCNEETISEVTGFIIVDGKTHEIRRGENKIGRDPDVCSIVLNNLTVSKVHAIIESEGVGDAFIYDLGSTNQTKLGKKCLKPHCRYKIDDGTTFILGEVSAKFIEASEFQTRHNVTPISGDLWQSSMCCDNDIFNVPTQAYLSHTNSNESIPEKAEESKNLCSKILNNCEAQSDPAIFKSENGEESKSDSFYKHFDSLENSNIFSLNTQCQVQQFIDSQLEESKDGTQRNDGLVSETEKAAALLLNDDQDDILCSIMAMHSPSSHIRKTPESNKTAPKIKKTNNSNHENEGNFLENQSELALLSSSKNQSVFEDSKPKLYPLGDLKNKELTVPGNKMLLREKNVHDNTEKNELLVQSDDDGKSMSQGFNKTHLGVPLEDSLVADLSEDSIITQKLTSDASQEINEDLVVTQKHNSSETQKINENLVVTQKFASQKRQEVNEDLVITQKLSLPETENVNEDLVITQKLSLPETENVNEDLVITQKLSLLETENVNEDSIITQKLFIKETPHKQQLFSEKNSKPVGESAEVQISNCEPGHKLSSIVKDLVLEGFEKPISLGRGEDNEKEETSIDNLSQGREIDDFESTQVYVCEEIHSSTLKPNEKEPPVEEHFRSRKGVNVSFQTTKKSKSEENILEDDFSDLASFTFSSRDSEDFIQTQVFDMENQTFSKPDELCSSNAFNESKSNSFQGLYQTKDPSSGDETESDLDIFVDTNENERNSKMTEKNPEIVSVQENTDERIDIPELKTDQDSNSSYVFLLDDSLEEPSDHSSAQVIKQTIVECSDSDETECSEIDEGTNSDSKSCFRESAKESVVIKTPAAIKNDNEKLFLATHKKKRLTDVAENSSKIEQKQSCSKFETHTTQEVNINLEEMLNENKTILPAEAREKKERVPCISHNHKMKLKVCQDKLASKRLREGDGSNEVTPSKKAKAFDHSTSSKQLQNENKLFAKLRRDHDINQILGCRTRNSTKSCDATDNSNKSRYSLRNNFNQKFSETPCVQSLTKSFTSLEKFPKPTVSTKRQNAENKKNSFKLPESFEVNSDLMVLRSASRKWNENQNNCLKRSSSPYSAAPEKVVARKGRREKIKKKNDVIISTVVFTGFECDHLDKIITELGGKKVSDLYFGQVVVTDKVRRTVKFLCAIGMGIPIASPQWLLASRDENQFLDPWNFILKDKTSEKKWEFDLRAALERSKKNKLLEGFSVFATENTKPPVKDLLAIVECCGGVPLFGVPQVWPKKTILVSCLEDEKFWPLVKETRSTKIVHYEFILSGVLRQQLDFKKYKLR